jgi:hypothetical protein
MSKKKKYDIGNILSELKSSEEGGEKKEFSSDFLKVSLEKDQTEMEVILRFVPNPDSETSVPWVFRPAHMIKFANGNFMYEPCPKKQKKGECPICEEVNAMYQSQNPKMEATASKQFAKKRYFHNVLVVKDPRNNGENEGKVFIYEYGKQVHDICLEALQDDDEPLVYFDPVDGANFKLKIVKENKDGFPSYTKSKFLKPSPIVVNDEELDEDESEEFVSEKCHKLNEKLMADKIFKSYDELRSLYDNQGVKKTTVKATSDDSDDDGAEEVIAKAKEAKKPKKVEVEKEVDEDDNDYLADDEESDSENDDELRALLADED